MALVSTPAERFEDLQEYDYPHDSVTVTDDGAEMAYVDVDGSGEETFLCLHGEPTWGFLYRKMIPDLRTRGRVVVPDFVGFGRSDKYTDIDAYGFETHYETLQRFVEALDLEGVTLVCQDWGSILGLPYAVSEAPERFDRIVAMNALLTDGETELIETWHRFKEMVVNADDLDIARVIDGGCVSDLSAAAKAGYSAPFPDDASKAGAYAWPPMVPQDPDMPGADRHARLREDLREWEKPFFVLFSDSDPMTEQYRDLFRELVPTADDEPDVWIEDAGHFLQEDAGEACAEQIVEFVDRH
ncbi:haloalkane dehalogenase [Natronomonas marina]|jgi:haloalkane dehalogenase|uniref:haloalkane dehalogenase n=1 Tax=Natronomonas marina TaxID=2961939 RepID=UPI0020C9FA44|nr:haloalkane dehalogenase [Natronomonas marina]